MPGPVETFAASFALAAIAGLMRLLNSNRELNLRAGFSSLGYSGCIGVVAALVVHHVKPDNPWLAIATAGLFGITGRDPAIIWEWVAQFILRGLGRNGHRAQRPSGDDEEPTPDPGRTDA